MERSARQALRLVYPKPQIRSANHIRVLSLFCLDGFRAALWGPISLMARSNSIVCLLSSEGRPWKVQCHRHHVWGLEGWGFCSEEEWGKYRCSLISTLVLLLLQSFLPIKFRQKPTLARITDILPDLKWPQWQLLFSWILTFNSCLFN